ncbi:MAG: DUF4928 family protein [Verrucomicrobiota bacterium]|jgi:hypothetical protein
MPERSKPFNMANILEDWLASCTRNKKISRNTVAMGVVVLDKLSETRTLRREEAVSPGGEISGARAGLSKILMKHGIPEKFLKEITTRQAHQDGQHLYEQLGYGNALSALDDAERKKQLAAGLAKLRGLALAWLGRQHIQLACGRQCSPATWIAAILDEAKGKSGGKVEQHLVGAKLEKRHPDIPIPNHPGHAGDMQTGRSGDFVVGTTCFHVTASPTSAVVSKCAGNIQSGLHPVLLVPREQAAKSRHLAEDKGIMNDVTIIAIEDFVASNIIELSSGKQSEFINTLRSIIDAYNRRLEEVETDMSLRIEVK